MRGTAMSGSPSTTGLAGLLLGAAAAIDLAAWQRFVLALAPDGQGAVDPGGPVLQVVATLLGVAGAVVLVSGVRRERGLLRASRLAGTALVVHAAADAALHAVILARPADASFDALTADALGALVLAWLGIVALVALAVALVRGRLLEPLAATALAVLAGVQLVSGLLGAIPLPAALVFALMPVLQVLGSLAAALLVVGLLVHGRTRAIRRRIRAVRRAW
ncbi:hypothetical protein DZF95_14695 [Clavibacter michiganensis]|nr:hypothetical protein DZF95_14695 [Clavibacter michiganensis]